MDAYDRFIRYKELLENSDAETNGTIPPAAPEFPDVGPEEMEKIFKERDRMHDEMGRRNIYKAPEYAFSTDDYDSWEDTVNIDCWKQMDKITGTSWTRE